MAADRKLDEVATIAWASPAEDDAARARAADMTPPPEILVVDGETDAVLVVHVVHVDGERHALVVYRVAAGGYDPAARHEIIDEPVDKYRALLFQNCSNVHVFVFTKLLRCSFMGCTRATVVMGAPLIGAAEFYQCRDCTATFNGVVNVVQVGHSRRVRFLHGAACTDDVMYLFNRSEACVCAALLAGGRVAGAREAAGSMLDPPTRQHLLVVQRQGDSLRLVESKVRELDLRSNEASLHGSFRV